MATALEVTPQDYGARGDGTADDTAAFQAALASGRPVRVPVTSPPQAGYRVGTLHLAGGSKYGWQTVRADRGALLKCAAPVCLSVEGSWVELSGFAIDMTGAPAGGAAVLLNTTSADVSNVRLSGLYFAYCWAAVKDTAGHFVYLLTVQDVIAQAPRGTQIDLAKTEGFILCRDVILDASVLPAGQAPYPLARFLNIQGLELDRFDVEMIGLNGDRYAPNQYAIEVRGGQMLWLKRVFVDQQISGSGILVADVDHVSAIETQVWASGHGVYLLRVQDAEFLNSRLYGYAGMLPNAPPGASGLYLDGCTSSQFMNTLCMTCTGYGVSVVNSPGVPPCRNLTFTGVHTRQCGGRGVSVAPASRAAVKVSGDCDEP